MNDVAQGRRPVRATRSFGCRVLAPLWVSGSLLLVGATPPGFAQGGAGGDERNWPTRTVRIISPFTPGSAGDLVARVIQPNLAEALRQSVVVDNRPGAGGNIAAAIAAKSNPDGYTVLMATTGTHAINAGLYAKLPYDPIRDFAPIAMVATSPNVLVVAPAIPVSSVKELIALARAKPGELNFGSSGSGTTVHLSGELFNTVVGLKTVHVPYKGAVEALSDLLAGRLQFMFASLSSALPQVRAGKLRALAVTSAQRQPTLPDVPTVIEAGVPGFDVVVWYALVAPAGTPRGVIERLNRATLGALGAADLKERMSAAGFDPAAASTPDQLQAYIRTELAKWVSVVKSSGARAD
ncbi:MAG: tripartite tricarboxylate transporter substrate binding protein [Proteobacteria bacterium]|nr:tripartite tricarboxylate transporter substrate binding protein [Burkholderiales bacterium]